MKSLKILLYLLKGISILLIIGLLLVPIVAFSSIEFKMNGAVITEWTPLLVSQLIINILVVIITLLGIYKLRIAIKDFYKRQLFNDVISKSFKQIGCLIIIGTLIHIVFNSIVELIFNSHLSIKMDVIYLMTISASLFFFTLSIMVEKAKGIQNENNLTI